MRAQSDAEDLGTRHRRFFYFPSLGAIPPRIPAPSARFVCFLVMDASGHAMGELVDLAARLVASGAVYVVAWGPECQLVEDAVDSLDIELHAARSDDAVIMTTSHQSDSLEEATWFALNSTSPADEYAAGCDSIVAIVVGEESWKTKVAEAFADPTGFTRRHLERFP